MELKNLISILSMKNNLLKESEKFEELQNLTDTDIMLNFANTLDIIYPNLIKIYAYAYDAWDEIVEPLFYLMVIRTIEERNGFSDNKENYYIYESNQVNVKSRHHVQVIPLKEKIKAIRVADSKEIEYQHESKYLVFGCFGNGEFHLSGGSDLEDVQDYNFNYTMVFLSPSTFPPHIEDSLWIKNSDCDYKMIYT